MLDALEPRRQFATVGLDPAYGTAGVAKIDVGETGSIKSLYTDVVQAGFANSGAGYVQVRQEYPAVGGQEQDYQDRYLVFHVNADGTQDTAFGTGGRLQTKAPGELIGFQTFAVSRTGRAVISDLTGHYHVFDADGREQVAAGAQLTRTITRLRGDLEYDSLAKIDFSATVTFDNDDRLLIPGQYKKKGKQDAVVLFRFTKGGLLDHGFGNVGRAFVRLSDPSINYSVERVVVGRDGQIVFTSTRTPKTVIQPGGGPTYTIDDLYYATISPAGALLARGLYERPPVSNVSYDPGGSGNLDLRPLPDGDVISVGYTGLDAQSTLLHADGTFTGTVLPTRPTNLPTIATPAGTLRAWVDGEVDDQYAPPEGHTDRFNTPLDDGGVNRQAVLGDGSLIAAGTDNTTRRPTLLVQKFDGTGLASPAAAGTATLQSETRTLDVRGTAGDDSILVTASKGLLHVRINGHDVPGPFSLRRIDTLHVSGGSGNDTIGVQIGRTDLAVRVRGDAGDDTLTSDAYQATLDGGSGQDTATLTPGSAANAVAVETLRNA